ncbi:conserved Plasmodium protein, unknown function [Plasmodium reichenowi]|uniref:Macro domain-containing protein n=1 Tax=Plasmodium reichenowi TaxID=5854 RepID=A0A060RXB3_PLARE|nr:hypothetical protein PRSY57_1313300 [Plasmodium reichenowi]KYN94583.1 hypothetical protein PRSY57_1313300 [Plasmodium reichenowi]CDO65937.1 conserved Plasmodium protein, unknown function [Plasmodium reichenowi]SOV81782.1 conserved Plasmodium protein, unknown function [Plasmodium reichenowi]
MLRFFFMGKRYFGSSYLTKRLKTINERALKYHIDYTKSLDILEGKNRSVMKEIFPNMKSEINDMFFLNNKDNDENKGLLEEDMEILDINKIKDKYEYEMKNMTLEEFGNIKIIHNDIIDEEADCMLIPMVSNFIPMSGFGSFILNKGGPDLVKEIILSIKNLIKRRIDILNEHKEEYVQSSLEINGEQKFKELYEGSKTLQIGDIILSKPHNVSKKVKLLAFLIMPYVWQGNSYISSNKLRYCFSNALKQLNELCISSIILPDISAGIYGYNPNQSSNILLEECVESLLQLRSTIPLYNINSISFVDKDYNTCKIYSEALEEVSRNYLPHKKVMPAPKYWNMVNRRLLEIPSNVIYFCRRHNKISFKKYHGIIRRKYKNYYSNIRPFKWRASRVLEPYPFLLYKKSGEPSSYQYGFKPNYYKNISHTLYNINKKGLVNIRVGSRGKLQALKKISNLCLDTKPRL